MKIANSSFENVVQLKYLGTTVTSENLIPEEIKRRLNSSRFAAEVMEGIKAEAWTITAESTCTLADIMLPFCEIPS
jgi:hypothetical protein